MPRLPKPGSDHNQWGGILNDFLGVSHNDDGTLKNTGPIASKYTKPSTGIPMSDLSDDVQSALGTAVTGVAPDATTASKGVVRLAGDLTGDAQNPRIASGAVLGSSAGSSSHIQSGTITDDNIHSSAGIAQTKIQNLTADLNSKINNSEKGTPNGLATLDGSGKLPVSQLPDSAAPSPAPVTSVAGKTGAVSLVKADVGLGNVDNTADLDKPISNAVQAALNGKVGSANASIQGIEFYPSNSDLPATGVAGVLYIVPVE